MAACATAGLWASPQVAIAAGTNDAVQQALPPQVKARMAQAKARRVQPAPQLAGAADTAPLVLTAFNVVPSVDAGVPGTSVVVSFKAIDDLAGARSLRAWAVGPSGQYIEVFFEASAPSTKLAGKMHSDKPLDFMEPGVYEFVSVRTEDYASNYQSVDGGDLAKLGKTTFTVKNKRGFDVTAPSFQSGRVLTPQISLSAIHPGTTERAFAQMTLLATDAGNSATAGVRSAEAFFCTLDYQSCFHLLSGAGDTVPLSAGATLKLGGQPAYYASATGDYHLLSLTLDDYAGNSMSWLSAEFGGETDFGTYFPSTTITLVP